MPRSTSLLIAAAIAIVLPTSVSLAAPVKAGVFKGKVAAGYGAPQFTLTVKAGKVTDVVARMLQSCNNGPQQQTIVAPSKRYKLTARGTFKGKSTESIGGVASETVWISGKIVGGKATGTIRSQTVGGGERCDTFERRFSAKR